MTTTTKISTKRLTCIHSLTKNVSSVPFFRSISSSGLMNCRKMTKSQNSIVRNDAFSIHFRRLDSIPSIKGLESDSEILRQHVDYHYVLIHIIFGLFTGRSTSERIIFGLLMKIMTCGQSILRWKRGVHECEIEKSVDRLSNMSKARATNKFLTHLDSRLTPFRLHQQKTPGSLTVTGKIGEK